MARLAAEQPARVGPAVVVAVADEATPGAESEARAVAQVHPGADVLIGPEATLADVRAGVRGAGVVHLACHGLFRAENLAFTSFRLADRWVRAADVAGLELSGSVIVLSACESGRSGRGGEEAAGLARGFLAAGARSVVVSQWLVDDRCTGELMVDLHRNLAAGAAPAVALRAAQLATIGEHPHPFHWAPFIVMGAPVAEVP
jgi:CHAT domain-containing protein